MIEHPQQDQRTSTVLPESAPRSSGRRLRITWVFPAYFAHHVGGYNVHFEYASRMAAFGHDVTLLFPRNLEVRRDRWKAPIWALRLKRRHRPLIGTFNLHPAVRVRLVADLDTRSLPDADILVATAWQTAEKLREAPSTKGRRYYIVYDFEHWQAAEPGLRRRIASTFRSGFRMVATSSAVSRMIRQEGGREVAIVPCGLDHEVFARDQDIAGRAPTLLFAARREATKNLEGVVKAASILHERYGKRLAIVAYGVDGLEFPDFVDFHPTPDNKALRRLYNSASIFLCGSFGEGWGLPSVEAMACGAALVTTQNGGSDDFAHADRTAVLTRSAAPDGLAEGVSRLVENEALRIRIAENGHAWVQQYRWGDAASNIQAILKA